MFQEGVKEKVVAPKFEKKTTHGSGDFFAWITPLNTNMELENHPEMNRKIISHKKKASMTLAEQIFEILESQSNPTKKSMESMECMHFPKTVAAICCCSANLPSG